VTAVYCTACQHPNLFYSATNTAPSFTFLRTQSSSQQPIRCRCTCLKHCYLQYLQLPTSTSNCLPPPPIVYLQLRVRQFLPLVRQFRIVGRGARIVGHATFAPTSRSAWARKRLMRGGTDTRLWFPRAPVSLCEGARLRSGWELLFLRAPFHLVSCWLVCCKSVAKSIWMSAFDAGRMLLLVNQALLFS
jgi:hypothetical protein